MKLTDFLERHGIKWFPINLKVIDGKKRLCPYADGTMPTTNDFVNSDLVTSRKDLGYLYVAVDTSVHQQVDVDSAEADEEASDLKAKTPYFKSSTKHLPHYFVNLSDPDKFGKRKVISENLELLNGQWSFAPRDTVVFNSDKPFFALALPVPEPKADDKYTLEGSPTSIDGFLELIDGKYVDDYDSWFRIGCAMRTCGYPFEAFDKWSRRSDKYDPWKIQDQWEAMANYQEIKFGTLVHYLKECKPDVWETVIKPNLNTVKQAEFFRNQNDENFSVSHQGLAELFHEQFKDHFVFYDKQWYVLNEFGILEPMGDNSKPVLKNKIYNFLFPFLTRNLRNNKNFGKIINLIGNASFQQGILLCCEGLFFVPYFTEKTDRNPLIIAFRNGVYDLETFQFRKGRKDDFVTLTTGYDYTPNEDTELFDKLLFSIWEDEPMVHWFKKHLGSLLEGKLTDEYFFIWNGCGRNGKGTIDTLLKSSLGEHSYYSTLSVGYLTKARDDAGKPEPEITKLRNARVVMTTEPDENAVLNTAKIKQISGNDTITGRNLYSNTMISFVAMFKLIFATNYLPQFTDCGDALLARMVPIPFPLQFLNKSDLLFDASNPNIRVADTSLKEKLAKKRSEFFNYMVRGYRLYKAEGINDFPPMVMACRNHYRKQTDVVGAWKEEQMTKASPTERISTKDLFENFKLWLMIEGNDEVNMSQKKFTTRLKGLVAITKMKIKGVALNGVQGYEVKHLEPPCDMW